MFMFLHLASRAMLWLDFGLSDPVPRVACLDLGQVVHVQDYIHVMFMFMFLS
jgi:hypothetical protein